MKILTASDNCNLVVSVYFYISLYWKSIQNNKTGRTLAFTQQKNACLKSTIETLEKVVKYVLSYQ